MITCAHCDAEIYEDPCDTTYSNYTSDRAMNGQHTGDIYKCPECEELTIDDFLEGRLRPFYY